MAIPKKRRFMSTPADPGSSGSESEPNSDDQLDEGMEVNVEFIALPAGVSDTSGIRRLLNQLFLKSRVNVPGLADLLIEQDYMTAVLKQDIPEDADSEDDDDEVYGVFSVINLTVKKELECVKQIRKHLLDHCKEMCDEATYSTFNRIISDDEKHVGLLLSERFMNIPPKIAVPLYDTLGKDMTAAVEAKKPFDFAYYILVSKTVSFQEGAENLIFLNGEEELFVEEADLSFEFPVASDVDSSLGGTWKEEDPEGIPKRKLMLFPSSKWNTLLSKLTAELG